MQNGIRSSTDQAAIGATWEDYRRAISNDATLLPAELGFKASLSDVFRLEVNNAIAALGTRVSGHVYLRDTAHPLSNVSIQLLDPVTPQAYSTTSAGDGSFCDRGRRRGNYSVSFHGFSTASPIQLTVAAGDITDQQWILTPGGTISGDVVLSPGGGPVRDVAVTAVAGDGTEYSTSTDDAGHYTIDSIPAGTYQVVTHRAGFSPAEIDNISIASGQILPHVNLSLQTGGTISELSLDPAALYRALPSLRLARMVQHLAAQQLQAANTRSAM